MSTPDEMGEVDHTEQQTYEPIEEESPTTGLWRLRLSRSQRKNSPLSRVEAPQRQDPCQAERGGTDSQHTERTFTRRVRDQESE